MTALVYPQLGSGALSQFPIRKTRRTRTVMNRAADGSTIKLADPAGVTTEWGLPYADLSDQEAALWDLTAIEEAVTVPAGVDSNGMRLMAETLFEPVLATSAMPVS